MDVSCYWFVRLKKEVTQGTQNEYPCLLTILGSEYYYMKLRAAGKCFSVMSGLQTNHYFGPLLFGELDEPVHQFRLNHLFAA